MRAQREKGRFIEVVARRVRDEGRGYACPSRVILRQGDALWAFVRGVMGEGMGFMGLQGNSGRPGPDNADFLEGKLRVMHLGGIGVVRVCHLENKGFFA